jgi:hypothetical protein
MSEEQAFGQESVEKSLGYVPAVVDMPQDVPQGDVSIQQSELRDAAAEISKARDERQRELESRPVDSTVEVRGPDGKPRPENETLSIEEASHLVTGARNQQENAADYDERVELARAIDAARNGVTSEQLLADQPQPTQQPEQPTGDQQAASQQQFDAAKQKVLEDNPWLLSDLQQHIQQANATVHAAQQQYAAALAQNAQYALAIALDEPEFAGLKDLNQVGGAMAAINASNPVRAAELLNKFARVQRMTQESQKAQDQYIKQAIANHDAQFQQAARQHDHAFETWFGQEVPNPAERKAIQAEVWSMLREGGTDQQIVQSWNSNWAFRSAQAQKMMALSAMHNLQKKKMADVKKNKLSRVPPVTVRPGSPLQRPSEQDYRLHQLNKGGGALTAREAADLVNARRALARR